MAFENRTLGSLLSDPRISKVAKEAIRNRDLKAEPVWNKTLTELKEEGLVARAGKGKLIIKDIKKLQRLYLS